MSVGAAVIDHDRALSIPRPNHDPKCQLTRCSSPAQRPVPQHLGQPQPLRLPPVENRLHDVGRQAGERQERADIGVRAALLLRKVGDRQGLDIVCFMPGAGGVAQVLRSCRPLSEPTAAGTP
jgi:hypothetical protein